MVMSLDSQNLTQEVINKLYSIIDYDSRYKYLAEPSKKFIEYASANGTFALNVCQDKVEISIDFGKVSLVEELISLSEQTGLIIRSFPLGVITIENKFLKVEE